MKRGAILAIVLGLGLALSPMLYADPVVFELDFTYSGTNPVGPTPWLKATFSEAGTSGLFNIVQLTMEATNLTGNEFAGAWYFNTISSAPLSSGSFSYDAAYSSAPEAKVSVGTNAFKAGSAGYFDIEFDFPEANNVNRFDASEEAIYYIMGQGLTPEDFKALNQPDGLYYTAAHVQGIYGELSGWIAATSGTQPIPEPTTMLLLGVGLIGLGFFGRKRFLK
jgi:hypothetical protein